MKWPKSGVFPIFSLFLGRSATLLTIRPTTKKSVATPLMYAECAVLLLTLAVITHTDVARVRALHGADNPYGYGHGVDLEWILDMDIFFMKCLGAKRITDLRYQDGAKSQK